MDTTFDYFVRVVYHPDKFPGTHEQAYKIWLSKILR
jgi:hypothetical protein